MSDRPAAPVRLILDVDSGYVEVDQVTRSTLAVLELAERKTWRWRPDGSRHTTVAVLWEPRLPELLRRLVVMATRGG